MSLYHCEGKLTKDPCKLLCLVQPSQHSDAPPCLASGRTTRYADVCTLGPEQFRLQESKVKPVLPTHFQLQDEIPGRIFFFHPGIPTRTPAGQDGRPFVSPVSRYLLLATQFSHLSNGL